MALNLDFKLKKGQYSAIKKQFGRYSSFCIDYSLTVYFGRRVFLDFSLKLA